MNDQISKLLQSMADKLGTTVTYLWRVLVHQAFVNGIGNLLLYIIITVFGIILFKLHFRFGKPKGAYERLEELVIIPMMLGAMVFIFMVIVCLFTINDTINSFFNPEYWALNHILKNI